MRSQRSLQEPHLDRVVGTIEPLGVGAQQRSHRVSELFICFERSRCSGRVPALTRRSHAPLCSHSAIRIAIGSCWRTSPRSPVVTRWGYRRQRKCPYSRALKRANEDEYEGGTSAGRSARGRSLIRSVESRPALTTHQTPSIPGHCDAERPAAVYCGPPATAMVWPVM